MARIIPQLTIVFSAALLSACSASMDSFWPDSLWPSQKAGNSSLSALPTRSAIAGAPAKVKKTNKALISASAPPVLGKTSFVPPKVTPGKSTGTFVGQKVKLLRSELKRMRQQISKQNGKLQVIRRHTGTHSLAYHSAIASINARLQVGTTPGNPYLIKQWNVAQKGLTRIDRDISTMNSLANSVASTSTMSAYLLETTRAAYGLSGAVEADHRQLAILEDEVNRTVVLIERLLIELSEDINRQTAYVAAERSNLTTLSLAIKNGEILGKSLANQAYVKAAPLSASKVKKSGVVGVAKRRPLVRIPFDRPNVSYQQALYTAVNRVLNRKPQAGFDLVAVASGKGSAAQVTVASNKSKRYAEKVLRSLMDMGLPLQRVRLSAMTSEDSKSNEVHLYVR